MAPFSRNKQTRADITALLRARNTLLWIVTREETRVERALTEASAEAGYETTLWDCAQGFTDPQGRVTNANVQDPAQALDGIARTSERRVFVLRDLHKWIPDPMVLRRVRNVARSLQGAPRTSARAIVVLTPSAEVPPELAGHATVIDWPLPEREEITAILDDVISALPEEIAAKAAPNGTRERAIDAAIGLNAEEAAACYARSLVTTRTIDPAMVASEKRRVIAREKVLTWYDPDPRGLDAVGGLEVLKAWLATRRAALSQRARDFGLPAPKGALLVGVPGCGKSLTAKAVASAWGLPLLRLDLGALRSKWVGESEGNIRRALAVAETVSPCVLWLDEIEKALAGSTGPSGDGGVAADALGSILSWMQERTGNVFVVATANDVRSLPPELLRKGRFDELFFVDLPTASERMAIMAATVKAHGRDPSSLDLPAIAIATADFTGAEIAAIVPDGLFAAFGDGERALSTADLVDAAGNVTPLAKTASEKIQGLRDWAKGKARPASLPEATAGKAGRNLDL
jgi:AAA+ superfamily predicted ATPase